MELLSLRPNDVITTNIMAIKVNLTYDFAELLLADLTNEGLLNVLLVVSCINEDYNHPYFFNSFDDFYKANSKMKCPICGDVFDFKNVKIGFKRGNY